MHTWSDKEVATQDIAGCLHIALRWTCQGCGTVKVREFSKGTRFEFPEGHGRHFLRGLPNATTEGRCPHDELSADEASFSLWSDS